MKQITLFEKETGGATFSFDNTHRFSLWRIWDDTKPLVMFIGLNPSTADETKDDHTIRSVTRISKFNGYGGFYMVNCWAFIATKPSNLKHNPLYEAANNYTLRDIAMKCKDVVFAWGNFSVVQEKGRDQELRKMFPMAKVIGLNKNGSPKHPLYQPEKSKLIDL